MPRCGARKVALQAKLPGKAPRFARRTARHSVASLLRSSLSAFGLTVGLQATLPEKHSFAPRFARHSVVETINYLSIILKKDKFIYLRTKET